MRSARVISFGLSVLCLLATASLFAEEEAKERKGQITVEVNLKAPAEAKHVRLWVPYPVSDANQTISDVMISGNYTSKSVHGDPRNGNSALYAEWLGHEKERKLTFSYKATRKEIIASKFPGKEQSLAPEEFNKFLELPYPEKTKKRLAMLSFEITRGKATVLAKTRAVYDWVVRNMRRDPNVKGCGLCDIERLLTDKAGKCADIHTVFVALLRASGVPAREVWGLRMHKEKEGDITKFQHCWAEFHLPGYGWVVADPADVTKFRLERDPAPEQMKTVTDYYFGSVDANRVYLGTGEQVILDPAQSGKPLLYFMYPYAEADGRMLNEDLYGLNLGYRITFKEE